MNLHIDRNWKEIYDRATPSTFVEYWSFAHWQNMDSWIYREFFEICFCTNLKAIRQINMTHCFSLSRYSGVPRFISDQNRTIEKWIGWNIGYNMWGGTLGTMFVKLSGINAAPMPPRALQCISIFYSYFVAVPSTLILTSNYLIFKFNLQVYSTTNCFRSWSNPTTFKALHQEPNTYPYWFMFI